MRLVQGVEWSIYISMFDEKTISTLDNDRFVKT